MTANPQKHFRPFAEQVKKALSCRFVFPLGVTEPAHLFIKQTSGFLRVVPLSQSLNPFFHHFMGKQGLRGLLLSSKGKHQEEDTAVITGPLLRFFLGYSVFIKDRSQGRQGYCLYLPGEGLRHLVDQFSD